MQQRGTGTGFRRRRQRFGARIVSARVSHSVASATAATVSSALLLTVAAVMQLLGVVQMLVRLHVNAQVALGRRRVVAHLATVRFVSAGISFAASQPGMRLTRQTVQTRRFTFRMFLLHVDLQCFLVFVVPVTFGTFQRLAGITGGQGHGGGGRTAQSRAQQSLDDIRLLLVHLLLLLLLLELLTEEWVTESGRCSRNRSDADINVGRRQLQLRRKRRRSRRTGG